MSWLVPFYVGVLYFCFGLAILNAGIFNDGLGYMATATGTVSTLVLQPIPTSFMAGYLPYKTSISPWLGDKGSIWIREETDIKDEKRYASVDDLPGCQPGMNSCRDLGHPEICCNENHTCLPTNNTSVGVYCCRSPDPVALPCDDTNLKCEPDWYQCSEAVNGGCCKYGQTCGLLECYDDGLTTTIVSAASITGSEDDTIIERTTIHHTNSTVIITSISTPSSATISTSLTTGSPITISDTVLTGTRTGGPITHLDPNRPEATSTSSAAGSRAKVGRHWSWAVMTWWIIAIIVEGV